MGRGKSRHLAICCHPAASDLTQCLRLEALQGIFGMKRTSKVEDVVSIALPEFLLEEFLPYRLSVAANRVSRMFAERYLSASELTVPEWRVLTVVGRSGTISPSAVGELAMMDKVKVS